MTGFELTPLGYIGPQIGLPFLSMGAALLALLVPLLAFLLGPFKRFFRWMKNDKKGRIVAALIGVVAAGAGGFFWLGGMGSSSTKVRVIVVGMDGLDPNLLDEYLQQELLPNFQKLKEQGTYTRLGTSNPALSPVAWSSFTTGSNPGRHGLFDFLRRNPSNYLPDLSLSEVVKPKFGQPYLQTARRGTAFWDVTSKHRIPTTVIRTPVTFPPDKVHGRMLSGLGVPDVRGTQGTFAFYTTDSVETGRAMGGQIIRVKTQGDAIETAIVGPLNNLAKPPAEVTIPMKLTLLRDDPAGATLEFQGQRFDLAVGQWSDWKTLSFKLNAITKVSGIVRFYLTSVSPELQLYLSPINFDPRNPAFPISFPSRYSAELAEEIGLYSTLGQAEDTWSLNEGRLSDETFLEECRQVIREREAMLTYELGRFRNGLLVCCFDTPDRVQHMFWRYRDTQHPLYDAAVAEKFKNVFPDVYRSMDVILGKVLAAADENTTVIVLSDHGFNEFRTAIHLNAWLAQEGFLAFKPGTNREETKEFFEGVDWSKSTVYAVGLAGVYLNREGREKEGIVTNAQVPELTRKLTDSMMRFTDPQTGKPVVKRLYPRDEIYRGPCLEAAPDFVIAFEKGYRSSWQTALGGVPPTLMEPNRKRWSGDHCVDPQYVPGVLLINRKISVQSPTIMDIAPTILKLFNIAPPDSVDGQALL